MNETHWIFSKKKFLEVEVHEPEENKKWADICDGKPVEFIDSKSGLCYVEDEFGMNFPFLIDKAWCERVNQEEEESE